MNRVALALALATIVSPCRADDPVPPQSTSSILSADSSSDVVHPGQWKLSDPEKKTLSDAGWNAEADPISKAADPDAKLTIGEMLSALKTDTLQDLHDLLNRDDVKKGGPFSDDDKAEARRLLLRLPTASIKKELDKSYPPTADQPKAGYDMVLGILWPIAFEGKEPEDIGAMKWPPDDSSPASADATPGSTSSTDSGSTAPPDDSLPGSNAPPPPTDAPVPPAAPPAPPAEEKPKEKPPAAAPASGNKSGNAAGSGGLFGCAKPAGAAGWDEGGPSGPDGSGLGALAVFLSPFLREAIRRRRR